MRTCLAILAAALLAIAGCGYDRSGDDPSVPAGSADAPGEEPSYEYEIFLDGPVTDTLRGTAAFNLVLDGETGRERFVIALESSTDLTSGFFLTRAGGAFPEAGTHPVEASAEEDSTGRERGFAAVYREGTRWQLASSSGTLELETASDTLMAGSFDVVMRGTVALPDQSPQEEVRFNARGSFRADSGGVGFIIGI